MDYGTTARRNLFTSYFVDSGRITLAIGKGRQVKEKTKVGGSSGRGKTGGSLPLGEGGGGRCRGIRGREVQRGTNGRQ